MKARILSLNIGHPQTTEWLGAPGAKSISTSMLKKPVDRLQVGPLSIDGDSFANSKHHGTPDAVLYAYGLDALNDYCQRIGRETYVNGELGENLTLDVLDESKVSVGDIFRIGSVVAQATFPRVPCAKINYCMEHALGQKAMIEALRSGIYFRILEPGEIRLSDPFERIEQAPVTFTIREVYERVVGATKVSDDDIKRVHANGAFPLERISKWLAKTAQ